MKSFRFTFPVIGAVLLAAILIFFRLPVSQLLDIILVKPLFASFEQGFGKDIILLMLLSSAAIWLTKEQDWTTLFRLAVYGLIFYLFQRTNSYWVFISTASVTQLAYWDLVIIVLVSTSFLCFILQRKSNDAKNVKNEGFIEDSEVISFEEDHFKRRVAAVEIARLIRLTNNKKSFAIGILGEYGTGKTSFLNLINLNLKEGEVLKVSFNPWSAGNPETIRREFFDLLAREVSNVDMKVSSLIYSYGRKLASFDTRSLSWLNWLGFLRNGGSVQNSGEYEQINKMLSATNQKIVISIDDLDRLYPAEIVEVLKLIRNTANFFNVIYLVGYDKAYVQGAMKTLNYVGGIDYLDKIFQLEIPLPKREEDDLLISLQNRLKEMISTDHYFVFENIMIPNGFRSRYEKAYSGILRQGRDVVRFLNGFKIVYKLIGEEVDFECLLILELIKFRFPTIYDLVYTQANIFLHDNPVRSTHEQYYSPKMVKVTDAKTGSDEVSVFKAHIERLEGLSIEDVSLLDGLFLTLFKGRNYHRPEARNSISSPLYFDIYFRYRLSQKDLSDKDFKAAITSGNMQKYMEYCATHGLHKELMVRLMQEDISKDRRHFEQIIRWIFSFGRTYVNKEGMFRFDYNALIDKIYDYYNSITDKLYKKSTDEYAGFLNQLFSNAPAPFLFENELLYHLKKKGGHFIIPISNMATHQLSYFTRMANSGHGLSEDTLWLFWGAREYYKIPAEDRGYYERWRFEPDLVVRMKSYLAYLDSKEFLKFSIQRDIADRSQCSINIEVMNMFDEPGEYRNLVFNNPALNEEIKKEYLELFDKLAEENFKQYVEIEFKTELHKEQ